MSAQPIVVYRGMKYPYQFGLNNNACINANYISSSRDYNVAGGFATNDNTPGHIYKLTVDPYIPFIEMNSDDMTYYLGEHELLFPKDVILTLTGVNQGNFQGINVYLYDVKVSLSPVGWNILLQLTQSLLKQKIYAPIAIIGHGGNKKKITRKRGKKGKKSGRKGKKINKTNRKRRN